MKTLYIFTLVLISSCVQSQDLTCGDFKIGTFKGEATNYKMPTLIVERFEKTQKEFADGVLRSEAKIKWKSECNFELNYLNREQKINVVILKIEGRKAICTATIEGEPGVILNFELEKLK
jgi:hypothetical protein